MNALIVTDIQNDFVPGGALAVQEGDKIVPVVNRLLSRFDIVVATQDWHPPDHSSFAANHPGKKPGDVIDLNGLPQILWPVHCVQNTSGAAFVPGLHGRAFAGVFHKGIDPGIDSYSALFDNAHRRATELGDFLKGRKVTGIYLVGLATDYCIKFTALDAVALGFKTHVIEDACRGINLKPEDVKNAIEDMKKAGVEITHSEKMFASK